MNKLWKVGELARLTGLTIRTLRFYDQIGLLAPSDQTESGHRLYDETDLARLHQILTLKELGLSLDEIKAALQGGQFSPMDIVELQRARVREQIRLQQKLLEQLDHVSKLLLGKVALTVDDFTNLLQAMKMEFDKPVAARRTSWERHLALLGERLAEEHGQKYDAMEEDRS